MGSPTPSRCRPTTPPTSAPRTSTPGQRARFPPSTPSSPSTSTRPTGLRQLGIRARRIQHYPDPEDRRGTDPRYRQVHHDLQPRKRRPMAHGPGHLEQQQPADPSQLISRHAPADAPNTGAPASPRHPRDDRSGARQPRINITGKHPTATRKQHSPPATLESPYSGEQRVSRSPARNA